MDWTSTAAAAINTHKQRGPREREKILYPSTACALFLLSCVYSPTLNLYNVSWREIMGHARERAQLHVQPRIFKLLNFYLSCDCLERKCGLKNDNCSSLDVLTELLFALCGQYEIHAAHKSPISLTLEEYNFLAIDFIFNILRGQILNWLLSFFKLLCDFHLTKCVLNYDGIKLDNKNYVAHQIFMVQILRGCEILSNS